jgi:sugar O-acyltransferase (sialic acid O-acetyltransferase NeuD family)
VQVFDDNPALDGVVLDLGIRIRSPIVWSEVAGRDCHVAVGNNVVRERLLRQVMECGGRPVTVAHPNGHVATSARIGAGSFVAAGAVISTHATVGGGVIINHGAVVDHDCAVGAFVHIAPNSVLGGRVRVGDRALIGASATVLPEMEVGADAVIGAGAVLTKNAPANTTFVGIPAKPR